MSNGWLPTVQIMLDREMQRHGPRRCLAWAGGSASYAETYRRTAALAVWMQANTEEGGRVAIALPNSREYIETMIACALAGRVRVPLNLHESHDGLRYKIEVTQSSTLVTTPELLGSLEGPLPSCVQRVLVVGGPAPGDLLTPAGAFEVAISASDSGALHYDAVASDVYRLSFTGGTTGRPRAVIQTHRQESAMIRNLLLETIRPSERTTFVASTPLAHASGAFVIPTLLRGGAIAWLSSFDPSKVVDAAWLGYETELEVFLVPTSLADITAAATRNGRHDVATIVYGGAPCPPSTMENAFAVFGERLVQVYGQAEAPMTIAVLPREAHADVAAAAGAAGWPFLFVDVAILGPDGERVRRGDVGAVTVAAEHIMSGYWGDEPDTEPSRIDEAGRLNTGDLGFIDEAGLLRLVGRSRNIVISGGVNLYPDDIDRRMSGIDGVHAVASFGVAHPRWGEALVMAVAVGAAARGRADEIRDTVAAQARERLGDYEQPKHVVVLAELPETDIGKIDTKRLKNDYADIFEVSEVSSR
jgi:fatty-acyl-CoA synthase